MPRAMILGLVVLLTTAVALVPWALAAEDDQTPIVSIVEPEGGTPQDWTYAPSDLTVAIGTSITWTNTGAQPHTVTADDGVSFDSGNLDSQRTFTIAPEAAGIYTYHCTYHPWMTGTLTVTN